MVRLELANPKRELKDCPGGSKTLYCTRVPVSLTSACFFRPSRKRLARQFLVAPSEFYLPGRGADFGQVLVSPVSR